jgi:outer membrane usher protein
MQQSPFRPFPSQLSPISTMVLSLFASANTWAAANDPKTPVQVAEVEFNDQFLLHSGGESVDIARFNKGNIALPGDYRADIYANGAWLGLAEIRLREVEAQNSAVQVCFTRELLERIGVDLMKLPAEANARLLGADAGECVTLGSLIPDATAIFDNGEQRLDITVPQVALVRIARGYVEPAHWDDGVTAARLQYDANTYYASASGASSTQTYVGVNAGINVGPWRFRHNGSLTSSNQAGTHYQSVQTNLQRSIRHIKSQLTVGDAFTDGALFDSVGFRGVQLASDDRMYPDSQRGYAPVVRGMANSNARVEVRQNGNLLYETTVAPGAFEIDDLYPTGYGGNLDVIITEADGTVRTSTVPYAAAVNALRPGITRFSVTLGQYRNPTVEARPILFQAAVQHGFTNLITGYGGFVASPDYLAAQLGVALNTNYGAFGVDVTQASTHLDHEPNRNGQSLRLSYSKLLEPSNTNLSIAAYRYSSRGYLGLADAMALRDLDERNMGYAANGTQRARLQLTVNQNLPAGYGSFYVSGSSQTYWDRDGTDTQWQAGYSNSYKRLNYSMAFSRQLNTHNSKWDNRVMLTLGIPLGNSPQAPYSTTSLQGGTGSSPAMATQTLSGSLGSDGAFGYSLNAGHSGGNGNVGTASNTTAGANAAYTAPFATFSGSASRSRNYTQGSIGLTGGVVGYAGGVAFTPTMSDTLAIVEAKDTAGARVTNGSGLRIDPWGHAIVSSLSPFTRNQIEIDPKGLPIDVDLKSTQQSVAPTAGAIVRLKFETENPGRAAILGIQMPDGTPAPFGADVLDEQGQSIGTIAQSGRVIARGLKSDAGKVVVNWGKDAGDHCSADYSLPKVDKTMRASYSVVSAICQ